VQTFGPHGLDFQLLISLAPCESAKSGYHSHDERQPLAPGEVVELDVEIWPTCVVVPAGYRIGLTVRGKDYEYDGPSGGKISSFKNELRGCGPFLHDEPRDRPPAVFGADMTLHVGPERSAYLLLPIIPLQALAN